MKFWLWGRYSRKRTPQHWVFFDLDDTLFICCHPSEQIYYDSFSHLTKIISAPNYCLYMIHFEQTRKLFHELQNIPNVKIGFITAASYDRQNILTLLEQVYELRPNALRSAIYINCHRYGSGAILKGTKLKALKRKRILKPDDTVLLVDDNKDHVTSAKAHNFSAILATGFFRELYADGYVLRDTAAAYLDEVLPMLQRQIIEASEAAKSLTKPEFIVTHAIPLNQAIVVRPEPGL